MHAVLSDVEIFMCGVYSERTFIRQALNLRTTEHGVIPLSLLIKHRRLRTIV